MAQDARFGQRRVIAPRISRRYAAYFLLLLALVVSAKGFAAQFVGRPDADCRAGLRS